MATFNPETEPHSPKDVNKWLATFTQWKLVRDPSGYYYFIHPKHAPSSGVYVHNLRGTTFAYWKRELDEYIERTAA